MTYITATTVSTTTTDTVFHNWVGDQLAVTDSAANSNNVWYYWSTDQERTNTTTMVDYSTTNIWVRWVDDDSEEERHLREAFDYARVSDSEYKENERKAQKLERKRKEAEEKAQELLKDLIGEEQLQVYKETGRLLVKGKNWDWILQKDHALRKITKNKIIDLCVHLENRSKYPDTDNVIALKLAIETDENEVNRLANVITTKDLPIELPRAACG